MIQVEILFRSELNDFLKPAQRGSPIALCTEGHQTIKHLIESCGVPHTEVWRILVDGVPVIFSYLPTHGDILEVFPYSPLERKQSLPNGQIRFILDMHLGKLARYLRLLGFDSLYRNDFDDDLLAEIAIRERRILLTRDRRLLMRRQLQLGYCPRALDPRAQLLEVLRSFHLFENVAPFQRCPHCNALLAAVSKESILDRLEPLTKRYYDDFHQCPSCQRVYWMGSHYEHMLAWIEANLKTAPNKNAQIIE